jgi:hypothetical protein
MKTNIGSSEPTRNRRNPSYTGILAIEKEQQREDEIKQL